jgi:hypothetical protein
MFLFFLLNTSIVNFNSAFIKIPEADKNNDYFVVRTSIDGQNWIDTSRVSDAGYRSSHVDYLIDGRTEMSEIVYYQLTQVDFDGKRVTFDPVAVQFKNESGSFY